LLSRAVGLGAQTFDATNLNEPTSLAGNWLLHAGDDPSYAQASLDDSHWTVFNPQTSLSEAFPNSHPQIVWYRLHLKVTPNDAGLAIEEKDFAGAFDVYANGQQILQVGQVAPYHPYTSAARLISPIPDDQSSTGSILLAVRVHLSPEQWIAPETPPDPTTLMFGHQTALRQGWWLSLLGDNLSDSIWASIVLVVSLLALTLFAAQRDRKEYLWTFLLGVLEVVGTAFGDFQSVHNMPEILVIPDFLATLTSDFLIVFAYFAFVRQPIRAWLWIFLAFSSVLQAANLAATAFGILPPSMSMLPTLAEFVPAILTMFLVPGVLLVCLRRGNREAGILLVPLFLSNFQDYLAWGATLLAQIPALNARATTFIAALNVVHLGPVAIPSINIGGVLCWLSMAAIMVMRFNRSTRRQAVLEGELAAAQQVQQVLLPEQFEDVPGFFVESVYQPAQQVGGDFFQVLPAGDGGLLVVVGDVAGKGLPAAMLVSVLVGAIRAVADYTFDPAEILASLNDRLVGRGGGSFSTASAIYIAAGGTVTIANAGHLPPYLDGVELDLPGAFPLGVIAGSSYETSRFHLPAGSRLTFYSDGVVEAQNNKGELFGFDRAKAISTRPASEIVRSAQLFGQEDDITVVTVQRDEAIATAA
jgi:hypothetical protein